LGGVDVNVEKSFTDTSYPAADDKYQTVTFQKGPAHMDGATALKYVRSRHGNTAKVLISRAVAANSWSSKPCARKHWRSARWPT